MNPIEMLENLFFIQPGYLNANHFVCRSSRPVLIDSGYADDWEAIRRLIETVGVDPAHIALIINTHTHCDHVGGNRPIQERSGCAIALDSIGRHFIDTRDDWSTWWRCYGRRADFFTSTHSLADGAGIQIGDHEFRVIFTPGHASDGIVLYHPRERLMKKTVPVESLFMLLMESGWYKETVDLFFNGAYRSVYEDVVNGFLRSGVIRQENQTLTTTVAP